MGNPAILKHESELHEMRAALGKAISSWGGIEGSLSLIFHVAISSRRSESADAVFNEIRSADAKLRATRAAFKMTFRNNPDLIAQWERLYKRTDKLRYKRNKLAHGQVVSFTVVGSSGLRVRFLPFYYPGNHKNFKAFEQWTISDLESLSKKFKILAADLFSFGAENIGAHNRQI